MENGGFLAAALTVAFRQDKRGAFSRSNPPSLVTWSQKVSCDGDEPVKNVDPKNIQQFCRRNP